MDRKASIRRAARRLGFPLCGFAAAESPLHAEFVEAWLRDGKGGTMTYLNRGLAKRLDPRRVLPAVRSIVTVGYPYRPVPLPARDWRSELRGRIAAYAFGHDYHEIVLAKLERLAAALRGLGAQATRAYVDTGPVLEREWAHAGGVGWFGKNTTILHRQAGSWFFLGEVLTDLEFEPEPLVPDHCGTCRRCLDLCPTGALRDGYELDARLCISYLTIEYRGIIPPALRPQMREWIFGCDVCQDVCPWNDQPARDARAIDELFPFLPDLLALDAAAYRERFRDTAISRAKYECFLRNVAIVLGNTQNPRAVPALTQAVQHPSPLVRAHAAWALGRIDDPTARRTLEQARRCEREETVRTEIGASLVDSTASMASMTR
jgi:epoxyqueuosine reductase